MGDRTRGLYRKFTVTRTDGSSAHGGKHDGCNYFVLDVTHDKHADAALLAYAASCEAEYPLLAVDVRDLANQPRSAAALPPSSPVADVEVIVNGQPVVVTAGTVRAVIEEAIRRSGQIGASIAQWELRTTEGDIIPHNMTDGTDYELTPGRRLWLNLGPPSSPVADSGKLDAETIQLLREYLWLGHGHSGQYGDDGEMQCGQCAPVWDYRRAPLADVIRQAAKARQEVNMAALIKQASAPSPSAGADKT